MDIAIAATVTAENAAAVVLLLVVFLNAGAMFHLAAGSGVVAVVLVAPGIAAGDAGGMAAGIFASVGFAAGCALMGGFAGYANAMGIFILAEGIQFGFVIFDGIADIMAFGAANGNLNVSSEFSSIGVFYCTAGAHSGLNHKFHFDLFGNDLLYFLRNGLCNATGNQLTFGIGLMNDFIDGLFHGFNGRNGNGAGNNN